MKAEVIALNKKIINCNKCSRLIEFRKKIVKKKRKQFIDQKYWGKPITGFGDINAKMLFVGLAPAAHGATRTGRVFTGDKSSEFLYKCMFKANISNIPSSEHINDGLKLNCFNFFEQEINLLKNLKVIIALGKIAFDACIDFYKNNHELRNKFKFVHGKSYKLPNNILLVGCYHPSPRNVNTGRINEKKMTNLFKSIKKKIN